VEKDLANKKTPAQPPPSWLSSLDPQQPMEARRVYRYFHLEQFSNEELEERFDSIVSIQHESKPAVMDAMTKEQVQIYLEQTIDKMESEGNTKLPTTTVAKLIPDDDDDREDLSKNQDWRQQYIHVQTQQVWNFLQTPQANNNSSTDSIIITKEQFVTKLRDSAQSVDFRRIGPLTLSMLMVGSTVGVTTPAMVGKIMHCHNCYLLF